VPSGRGASREPHKARRKLDHLQDARRAGTTVQPAAAVADVVQPAITPPKVDKTLGMIEAAREAIETAQKTGGKNWSQSFQKRTTAKGITENLKKKQAEHAKLTAKLGTVAPGVPDATL